MEKKLKVKNLKPAKGRGYVGTWLSGELGWEVSPFVFGQTASPIRTDRNKGMLGEKFYLCEITIKPVKDKLGRYITRIVKK